MPARLILLLALLAPLLLGAPADAAVVKRQYAVDVTAIHVVDWQVPRSGDPCQADSFGTGTQTTGFQTRKAVRYGAILATGRHRRAGMPAFTLAPFSTGRFEAVVTREADWADYVPGTTAACTPCGPSSEYGACDGEPVTLTPLYECGRRAVPGAGMTLGVADGRLRVEVLAPSGGLFGNCPPDGPWNAGYLSTPDPAPVVLGSTALRRMKALRRGRSMTVKQQAERQGPTAGRYRDEAVTAATVEIRRTR